MKPLSLLQPTIFLMMGIPGAGKSYFARRFSEKYSIPCVSIDRLRTQMVNEPQYTPAEQTIVNRVADYMTDELLCSKRSFVIDGLHGNVRSQRLSLERRARQHGFSLLVVWVQVDQATARARSFKRNPKKVDDQYNRSIPEATFSAMVKQLTPPNTENHVVISGKHTFSAQRTAVLRKLPREPQKIQTPAARPVETAPVPEANDHSKVITPTPQRRMGRPDRRFNTTDNFQHRPEQHRISISET